MKPRCEDSLSRSRFALNQHWTVYFKHPVSVLFEETDRRTRTHKWIQHARLRDTLRVFLHENGSFKATAERLILHKNSVQYRVRKAEEALGHPVGDDRLSVELALLASLWLGPTVLRHPRQPRP